MLPYAFLVNTYAVSLFVKDLVYIRLCVHVYACMSMCDWMRRTEEVLGLWELELQVDMSHFMWMSGCLIFYYSLVSVCMCCVCVHTMYGVCMFAQHTVVFFNVGSLCHGICIKVRIQSHELAPHVLPCLRQALRLLLLSFFFLSVHVTCQPKSPISVWGSSGSIPGLHRGTGLQMRVLGIQTNALTLVWPFNKHFIY